MIFQAFVTGIYGAYYIINPIDNPYSRLHARLTGGLRPKTNNSSVVKFKSNIISVGDNVLAKINNNHITEDTEVYIVHIQPRINSYQRASFHAIQILAANLDTIYFIISLAEPPGSIGFINRVIAEAELSSINIILIVNKIDLYDTNNPSHKQLLHQIDYLNKLGYNVYKEKFVDHISLELSSNILSKPSRNLIIGQSGAGKSTFLNLLVGSDVQTTQMVSARSLQGKHTTTNPILFSLDCGVEIIDAPGLREFGLYHRNYQSVQNGFIEIITDQCKFDNCVHYKEPVCSIQQLVQDDIIPQWRFSSYISILKSLSEHYKHRRGNYLKK